MASCETIVHGKERFLLHTANLACEAHTSSGQALLYRESELCDKITASAVSSHSVASDLHRHGRIVLIKTQSGVVYIGPNWKQLRTVGRNAIPTWASAFFFVGGPVCKGPGT